MQLLKTKGTVIKLDKSFPLVRISGENEPVRVEYSANLAKSKTGVTIGDDVLLSNEIESDLHLDSPYRIAEILPRKTELSRLDAVDRGTPQIMAANFDEVIICESAYRFNFPRLVRELVIANNSGARVLIFITKCDLLEDAELQLIEKDLGLFSSSYYFIDREHFSEVESVFSPNNLYVLLGSSGVGKSTLINHLCGSDVQKVGEVREKDLKGKHTTVAREIFTTISAADVIDMPGVRSVGIYDAEAGMQKTFPSIYEKALDCRFRNCTHTGEPGCGVKGNVPDKLIEIWRSLKDLQGKIK